MRFLGSKYARNAFAAAPDPAGGAYSVPPDPLAGFKGTTWQRREWEGEGMGRGKGKERKGQRKGGEGGSGTWKTWRLESTR